MTLHARIALIRTNFDKRPIQQKAMALLVGALFLVIFLKFLFVFASHKPVVVSKPLVIREGNQIKIPSYSALRAQVFTKRVGTLTVPHIVSVPGMVEADPFRTVNILPPLTGRLISLKVRLGDFVKKDQILAVVRSPDLAQAYSDYNTAKGVFILSDKALKRVKQVNRAGANAIKDIELAQSNYTQALAELNRAEERLKAVGHSRSNKVNQLNIRAPVNGWITALNYGRGSYVTDATVPLLTMSDLKEVWITANVPENLAGKVVKGQRVVASLPAYPGLDLHGEVSFVSSVLEPDTRRNKTRIKIANPDGRLQPNMFATVNLFLPQPSEIIIPVTAVLMNNDTTSVYIETAPWVFERREVKLGLEDGDNIRVLSGLKLGERVVTSGGIFVND